MVLELWELSIFIKASDVKLALGGRRSNKEIVVCLANKLIGKSLVYICCMVLELWKLSIFILASDIRFALGGQRSNIEIVVCLANKLI